jgi:AcrR family transcriptional regulator
MSRGKPQTRTAILDAAWRLIERRGEADVRLEDVAREARLSRQAVYLHFDGRGALLVSLIQHIQENLDVARRLRRIDEAASGEQMLVELVRFSAQYTPRMFPFARALDAVRRRDADAAAAWEGRMKSRLARAARIARRLAAEKRLAPGVNPREAADVIWSLTSIATWEDLVVRRRWSRAGYTRRILALLRAALLRSPDGRRSASAT